MQTRKSSLLEQIKAVLANDSVRRISNCQAFLDCIKRPYQSTVDSEGFYHPSIALESVKEADRVLEDLVNVCTKIVLVSREGFPEFSPSRTIQKIEQLAVSHVPVKATRYFDRNIVVIDVPSNFDRQEKKRVLGVILALNARGYLGVSEGYKRIVQNIMAVI